MGSTIQVNSEMGRCGDIFGYTHQLGRGEFDYQKDQKLSLATAEA